MTIRDFRPRTREQRGISTVQSTILASFLGLTIIFQIGYPLLHGDWLRYLTISIVIFSALFCLYHAILNKGTPIAFAIFFITISYAYLAEFIGIKLHWPFGFYHYDPSLGISLNGVPLLVPIAWFTIVYPVLIATTRTIKSWRFLYAALGIAAWDLFLDPEMVHDHRWIWEKHSPHFPFESAIPLSNFFGWLLAGIGLFSLLLLMPESSRRNGATFTMPYIYMCWVLFTDVVGNAFFFHRPGVAFIGGVIFFAWFAPVIYRNQLGDSDS